jgi:hypothetical protein
LIENYGFDGIQRYKISKLQRCKNTKRRKLFFFNKN